MRHAAVLTAAFLAGIVTGALALVLAPEIVAALRWRPRVTII